MRGLLMPVYVIFGLFVIQKSGDASLPRFKDGWNYNYTVDHNKNNTGTVLTTLLKCKLLTGNNHDELKFDSNY